MRDNSISSKLLEEALNSPISVTIHSWIGDIKRSLFNGPEVLLGSAVSLMMIVLASDAPIAKGADHPPDILEFDCRGAMGFQDDADGKETLFIEGAELKSGSAGYDKGCLQLARRYRILDTALRKGLDAPWSECEFMYEGWVYAAQDLAGICTSVQKMKDYKIADINKKSSAVIHKCLMDEFEWAL